MPRVNIKDKRKQQLMEANIASIARRGLVDTTIAHVSKGANMSRGIVNFYFTSKEKMMQETLMFLAEEATDAWVEIFKAEREKNSDPLDIAEAVLRVLMGDRLCSNKRMAVWAAFIGHAGTHGAFAKIIRAMDDALAEQLSMLWQEAGYGAKAAGTHARQLQSLIRGHWLMSAVAADEKRPSAYIEPWVELLRGVPPSDAEPAPKEKAVKSKSATPHKPKKNKPDGIAPGQLDFGDLFSNG